MERKFTSLILNITMLFFLMLGLSINTSGQVRPGDPSYETLKADGRIWQPQASTSGSGESTGLAGSDTTTAANKSPVPKSFPKGPVTLSVGKHWSESFEFISPEPDQVTTIDIFDDGLTDLNYTNFPGKNSKVKVDVFANPEDVGIHYLLFIAIDDRGGVTKQEVKLDIQQATISPTSDDSSF